MRRKCTKLQVTTFSAIQSLQNTIENPRVTKKAPYHVMVHRVPTKISHFKNLTIFIWVQLHGPVTALHPNCFGCCCLLRWCFMEDCSEYSSQILIFLFFMVSFHLFGGSRRSNSLVTCIATRYRHLCQPPAILLFPASFHTQCTIQSSWGFKKLAQPTEIECFPLLLRNVTFVSTVDKINCSQV